MVVLCVHIIAVNIYGQQDSYYKLNRSVLEKKYLNQISYDMTDKGELIDIIPIIKNKNEVSMSSGRLPTFYKNKKYAFILTKNSYGIKVEHYLYVKLKPNPITTNERNSKFYCGFVLHCTQTQGDCYLDFDLKKANIGYNGAILIYLLNKNAAEGESDFKFPYFNKDGSLTTD